MGEAESDRLTKALIEQTPPVSVRFNSEKPGAASHFSAISDGRVPWSSMGLYLNERPRFTYDPLFHAGLYYVQEASSMFVEAAYRTVAKDFTPRRVLDLCAAPGGKSTLWRSLMTEGALLVANEPVRQRTQILAENLLKWGQPDVVTTRAFPADFAAFTGYFDVVAADVPCSGEGMFRKDEGSIAEWRPESPAACAARSFEIIRDVWPALREGGYLVYSTCTFNAEENEENVYRICSELGAEPVAIPVAEEFHITGDLTGRGLPVYRFLPHLTRGEGFFLALLRKTSSSPHAKAWKSKRGAKRTKQTDGTSALTEWLRRSEFFETFTIDGKVQAVRRTLFEDVTRLTATLPVITAGIPLAYEKGRKYVPEHGLALSIELSETVFPRVDLQFEEALSYLRREALTLPAGIPRGYVVVTYEGRPIGFVNQLGSRANNLYPAEWRIRN